MLNETLSADIPTRIMQSIARFAAFNPPRIITDQDRVNDMLQRAGIQNGYFTPTGSNLTKSVLNARSRVEDWARNPINAVNLMNGWKTFSPHAQGDYGTDYMMRSYIASYGYLALVATEASYPAYYDPRTEGSGILSLESKQAYIITFASKPPLTDLGFWSVTTYNAQQYLVPNPLNRYALGDRSSLTYADGSPVYDNGSKNDTFQVLVQPADVQPPKNWTSK